MTCSKSSGLSFVDPSLGATPKPISKPAVIAGISIIAFSVIGVLGLVLGSHFGGETFNNIVGGMGGSRDTFIVGVLGLGILGLVCTHHLDSVSTSEKGSKKPENDEPLVMEDFFSETGSEDKPVVSGASSRGHGKQNGALSAPRNRSVEVRGRPNRGSQALKRTQEFFSEGVFQILRAGRFLFANPTGFNEIKRPRVGAARRLLLKEAIPETKGKALGVVGMTLAKKNEDVQAKTSIKAPDICVFLDDLKSALTAQIQSINGARFILGWFGSGAVSEQNINNIKETVRQKIREHFSGRSLATCLAHTEGADFAKIIKECLENKQLLGSEFLALKIISHVVSFST